MLQGTDPVFWQELVRSLEDDLQQLQAVFHQDLTLRVSQIQGVLQQEGQHLCDLGVVHSQAGQPSDQVGQQAHEGAVQPGGGP